MRRVFQKIILSLLIIVLIVPPVLFSSPKRSEAILDCFLGNILGSINGAVSAVSGALSVPVYDAAHSQISTQNLGQQTAQTTKECVLDFLVNVLANTMIQQFTNSIVDWINRGFHGSPSFVTNPEGFFREVGDIAVGQAIEDLGLIGELLCSGFDLDLRLALGLQYSTSRREYVGCRLSDVEENLMQTFSEGNFGGDAGWRRWFSITSDPRNNPYGTYFRLVAETDRKIYQFQNRKLQELTQGRGFLSYKKCPSPDGSEEAYYEDLEGKCEVVTPGAVIENQLNSHLGSATRRIELADEINEIIGALVNQALVQVMGATGLAGGSQRRTGGGRSFVYQTPNTQEAYEQELAIQSAQSLPAGITITCDAFEDNSYEIRAVEGGGNSVFVQTPIYNAAGVLTGFADPVPALRDTGEPWTDVDLRTVDAYCRNQAESDRAGQYVDIPDWDFQGTVPVQPEIPNYNLALRRPTRQSSTYSSYPSARAVDGNTVRGYTAITDNEEYPWWEVELDRRSYIDHLRIHVEDGENSAALYQTGAMRIEIFDYNNNGVRTLVRTLNIAQGDASLPIPWSIPVDAIGRFVRITRTNTYRVDRRDYWHLHLPEVEVMGQDSNVQQAGSTGNTETPLQLLLEPQTQRISMRRGEDNIQAGTRTGIITVTTNRPLTGLTLSVTFTRRNVLHEFGQVFTSAGVTLFNRTGNANVISHTLPTGASMSTTGSFELQPDRTYEIWPILQTKSLTLFDEYLIRFDLKNSAGITLGSQATTLEVRN